MAINKEYLKSILALCDYCKECIEPCTVNSPESPNTHSPLVKIKISDLLYRGEPIPKDMIEELAHCTLCGLCNDNCPPHIDVIKLIHELRKWAQSSNQLNIEKWDDFAQKILSQGNPYGEDLASKLKILKPFETSDSDLDFHLYLGCTLPLKFTEQSKTVLKVMQKLQMKFKLIDSPICCAGILDRTGKEKEFNKNIKTWEKLVKKEKIKEIVVFCPGCYSILVQIAKLLNENVKISHIFEKIFPSMKTFKDISAEKIGLHISCHLFHINPKLYDELTKHVPGLIVPETRSCCGAGGGLLGYSPSEAGKIAQKTLTARKEQGINSLITECPFCFKNLSSCESEIEVIYLFDYIDKLLDNL